MTAAERDAERAPVEPRWRAGLELAAVAALLGWLPSLTLPVPGVVVLLAAASLSVWLRGQSWERLGLEGGPDLGLHILTGAVLGTLVFAVSMGLWAPALEAASGHAVEFNLLPEARGNAIVLVSALLLVWAGAWAAEMVFRGYLLRRVEDAFGGGAAATAVAVAISALAYGWFAATTGEYGSLPLRFVGAAVMGVGYGLLYFAGGRRLALPIVFHGAFETTNLVLIYGQIIG